MANLTSDGWDPKLVNSSADINRWQVPASIVWLCLSSGGLLMSSLQIALILTWKPLRTPQHSLVLTLAINDFVRSVTFGLMAIKRLRLAALGRGELTSQYSCMLWLSGINFSVVYSNCIMLVLSADRLMAVAAPVWFKSRGDQSRWCMSGGALLFAVGMAAAGLLGTSQLTPNASCTVTQSPTATFSWLQALIKNLLVAVTVFFNLVTCLAVYRRYRVVRDRNALRSFKRDIELNALKTLAATLLLFFATLGASAAVTAGISASSWNAATKASYSPIAGCLPLISGLFDVVLFLVFSAEYRKAFLSLFGVRLPDSQSQVSQSNNGNRPVKIDVQSVTAVTEAWKTCANQPDDEIVVCPADCPPFSSRIRRTS